VQPATADYAPRYLREAALADAAIGSNRRQSPHAHES
jgi:hypothetical protein